LESKLENLNLRENQVEANYQQELNKANIGMRATCENVENLLTLNLVSLSSLKTIKEELVRASNARMAKEVGDKVYEDLLKFVRTEKPNATEDNLPPNVFVMNEAGIENYMECYRRIRSAFAQLKEFELD
jgi:hypothetical protein